jgi:hypothetical protein
LENKQLINKKKERIIIFWNNIVLDNWGWQFKVAFSTHFQRTQLIAVNDATRETYGDN